MKSYMKVDVTEVYLMNDFTDSAIFNFCRKRSEDKRPGFRRTRHVAYASIGLDPEDRVELYREAKI